MKLQYITDETGQRLAAVIPIEEFEQLLEDLEDLGTLVDRKDESSISHDAVVMEMRRSGLLD